MLVQFSFNPSYISSITFTSSFRAIPFKLIFCTILFPHFGFLVCTYITLNARNSKLYIKNFQNIVITPDAEADLDGFIRYLLFEKKSEQAASNVLNDFEKYQFDPLELWADL